MARGDRARPGGRLRRRDRRYGGQGELRPPPRRASGRSRSADLVGTDLTLDVHVELLADLDRTPGPLPYLEDLVASGRLGFKTGEGFRKWTPAEQAELRAKLTAHLKKMAAELDRPSKGG